MGETLKETREMGGVGGKLGKKNNKMYVLGGRGALNIYFLKEIPIIPSIRFGPVDFGLVWVGLVSFGPLMFSPSYFYIQS